MVPLASAVGKVIGLFVVARIIPRNGSETQAVAGSGDAVCLCLCLLTAGVGILITNPLTTQPSDAGDGAALTCSSSVGSSLTIHATNGTNASHVTISVGALHRLTLTGSTGAETLDGNFLTFSVEVGGDGEEVGSGSVHAVVFL